MTQYFLLYVFVSGSPQKLQDNLMIIVITVVLCSSSHLPTVHSWAYHVWHSPSSFLSPVLTITVYITTVSFLPYLLPFMFPLPALITPRLPVSGFILSVKGQQQGFPWASQLAALAIDITSLMLHINNKASSLAPLMPPACILKS